MGGGGGGGGGGGPRPTDWKRLWRCFFFSFFCKSPAYFSEGAQWWLFQRKLSLNYNFSIFHGEGRSNISRGSNFSQVEGSNCIFLYKPIEFVIFRGAGVWTPATSSGSARGIVNWIRPHIVLAKRLSMTLTPLMQVLCGCGKQRQGPTV